MTEFNSTQLYFSRHCCRQKRWPFFHPPGTRTRQVGFLGSCLTTPHWVKTTRLLPFMTFSPPLTIRNSGKTTNRDFNRWLKAAHENNTTKNKLGEAAERNSPDYSPLSSSFCFVFSHSLAWLASVRLCCPNVSSITLVADGIIRGDI